MCITISEQLAEYDHVVEHQSISAFLKRIPHRWHMEEIGRFGDKAGRAAESLHVAYLTAIDGSLGVVRVFPVPLLRRVYAIMAPQFNWPGIEIAGLEDARQLREDSRARESVERILGKAMQETDDVEILQSLQKVLNFLEHGSGDKQAEEIETVPRVPATYC